MYSRHATGFLASSRLSQMRRASVLQLPQRVVVAQLYSDGVADLPLLEAVAPPVCLFHFANGAIEGQRHLFAASGTRLGRAAVGELRPLTHHPSMRLLQIAVEGA